MDPMWTRPLAVFFVTNNKLSRRESFLNSLYFFISPKHMVSVTKKTKRATDVARPFSRDSSTTFGVAVPLGA
jgi:hypothetical protein